MYQKFSAWSETNGNEPIPAAKVVGIDAFLVYHMQLNARHIRADIEE